MQEQSRESTRFTGSALAFVFLLICIALIVILAEKQDLVWSQIFPYASWDGLALVKG